MNDDDFSSPVSRPQYLDMRKGEEFFLKNMLGNNKTGVQILQETSGFLKETTERSLRSNQDSGNDGNTKRSDMAYNRQHTFSRNDNPEGGSHPPLNKRPVLMRMNTLEVIGSPNGKTTDDWQSKQQLDDLTALVGVKKRTGDTVVKPKINLYPANTFGETRHTRIDSQGRARFTRETLLSNPETAKHSLPANVVDQRSAQIDMLLNEWDGKLQKVEDRLSKNKRAKEELLADYLVMEKESQKVSFQINEKQSQVDDLRKLIDETKAAADRITKSMHGLTLALERERTIKFK